MEMGRWCSINNISGRRSNSITLGRASSYCNHKDVEEFVKMKKAQGSKKYLVGWKILWMKLKRKDKKRVFERYSKVMGYGLYDPCTYAQNFDEGHDASWNDDPDNLSRSFSARFANPSRSIFLSRDLLL